MTRQSDQAILPGWALRLVAVGALVVLIGAATPPGAAIAGALQGFLIYYAGVFALVAMSTSVIFGLAATERLILRPRHRVFAQAVHRAASLMTVTFLISHVMVKVLDGRATSAQVVVPYLGPIGPGAVGSIGFGALASDLLLVIVVTGLLRARFALGGRPWLWRMMHALSYIAWPVSLVHGLTAGRTAPDWVVLSYILSLLAVAVALVARLMLPARPREMPRRAAEPATAGTMAGASAAEAAYAAENAFAAETAFAAEAAPRAAAVRRAEQGRQAGQASEPPRPEAVR